MVFVNLCICVVMGMQQHVLILSNIACCPHIRGIGHITLWLTITPATSAIAASGALIACMSWVTNGLISEGPGHAG